MKAITIIVLTLTLMGCAGVQIQDTAEDLLYASAIGVMIDTGHCIPLYFKEDIYYSLVDLQNEIIANKGTITLGMVINQAMAIYNKSTNNKIPVTIQLGLESLVTSLQNSGSQDDILHYTFDNKILDMLTYQIKKLGKAVKMVDDRKAWCP